jgi:hypothetical protein
MNHHQQKLKDSKLSSHNLINNTRTHLLGHNIQLTSLNHDPSALDNQWMKHPIERSQKQAPSFCTITNTSAKKLN